MADLSLPSELGTIEEIYVPRSENLELKTTEHPSAGLSRAIPGIILIQDAHAVPDAQQSILELVKYLNEHFGLNLVGLEGASGRLDPTLLRNCPDKGSLNQILEDYLSRGEISGAAAAAVLSGKEADYYGIEDQALYEEGINQFLQALQSQPALLREIVLLRDRLSVLKKAVYSPELFDFDQRISALDEDTADWIEFFKYLGAVKPAGGQNPDFQKQYPHLAAVFKEICTGKAPHSRQVLRKIQQLSQIIQKRLRDKKQILEFRGKLQDFETERIGPEAFAHYLYESAMRMAAQTQEGETGPEETSALPDIFRELHPLIDHYDLLNRMKGPVFLRELDTYVTELKKQLYRNDSERRLDRLSREYRLLAKLVKLELSRDEWDEIDEIKEEIQDLGSRLQKGEEAALQGRIHHLFSSNRISTFIHFYQIAEQRDHAFYKNITRLMKENTAILVAGGFHTQGLRKIFKENGIAYALIAPAMRKVPRQTRYFDYMRGEVSWKDYFEVRNGRIRLYDAFMRATVDRLFEKVEGGRWKVERKKPEAGKWKMDGRWRKERHTQTSGAI
ncbi:MAG: hypothetical protein NC930_04015 [Candidatus Omnitrophica bacterium]|nr:hypothetical protein [Candidatus Omnitrophota bacterium]